MRSAPVAVLALLLISGIPVLAAEVEEVVLTDGSNDVVVTTPDGGTSQPEGGNLKDVDIQEVGIAREDDASITFFVKVVSLTKDSQNPAPFGDPDYRIYFDFGEQTYRAAIDLALTSPTNDAFGRSNTANGRLEMEQTADSFRVVTQGETELDFSDNRALVTIPRGAIVDHTQAPLGRNATLQNIWATATSMGWFAFPVGQTQQGGDPVTYAGLPRASDQAPDELTGILPSYTMQTGPIKARGGLFAGSPDPIRWTNGEASTLVFTTTVSNTLDEDVPVLVDVKGSKSEWTLAFSDSLTVPRNSFVNVSFLITIPFSHNHGSIHMFEARFEEVNGNAFAATDLGVYWPLVPQPAGHHDTMWFHSLTESADNPFEETFGTGNRAWFSAAQEEESDRGVPVTAFTFPASQDGEGIAFWRIFLEPALRMGLDFRPEDPGNAEITVNFPTAVVDPYLDFQVYHAEVHERRGRNDDGLDKEKLILEGSSEMLSGPISGRQTFEVPLEVAGVDDIPFRQDSNLFVNIIVRGKVVGGSFFDPASQNPQLIPASTWMQWPLNEYHEPVDTNFQTDGNLELSIGEEGQSRDVNPGNTIVYTFDMAYHGSLVGDFRVEVSGTHAEWAQVIGDDEFSMEAHSERRLGMAVTAPKDAKAGERADLVFKVVSSKNAALQAGINTITTVTTSVDIPDESARIEDLDAELTTDKDSPGLPLIGLLGAIAIALRRRK